MEGSKKKNCMQILPGVVSKPKKKSWPLVRPLNVPELLSPGQSCLLAGKDALYYMVSLLSELNPLALVAGLQGQQLRQLPYGWGMLLVSQHCSNVLLTTIEMNALGSPYSQSKGRQFPDCFCMLVSIYHKRGSKGQRGRPAHFSHTWDWICPSSPFGILMYLDSEWFCLVGASTGWNSSPPRMRDFTGGLSCYSTGKPQAAQKEKLEAKPSKSGFNVQWKKRCQKVLKCPAGSVSSQQWMGASVLPCTDGRAKGQGTKGYILIQDLWGQLIFVIFCNCSTH